MQATTHPPPHQAPDFPAGEAPKPAARDNAAIPKQIDALARQPQMLRDALRGLDHDKLETRYRNWTVRQITHHLADATANAFVRWKLALTENNPTIKPYDEGDWVRLPDSLHADPALSVNLFASLIERWVFLMRAMKPEDFDRTFYHPQYEREIPLWYLLAVYAWHGEHHVGQIDWLRLHYRW